MKGLMPSELALLEQKIDMITQEEIVNIGKFQKTHALKGELNMISDIDPEYFLEGNPLIVECDGILVPFYVESIRPKGSTSFLVKLSGIDIEEDAAQFVNKEIGILKKDAENWFDDELMDAEDLKGYSIIDAQTEKKLGIIERVDFSTANHLFIIREEDGEEVFLPANEDFINEVDEENHEIKMIVPEGLINLNKKE